jgi:hypothetical protein
MGDLCTWFFDPANGQRQRQWDDFFQKHGRATEILNWWVSSNNSVAGRQEVEDWAVNHVAMVVKKEAEGVTRQGILRTDSVDDEAIIAFNFGSLFNTLKTSLAPVSVKILESLSHSARQLRRGLSPFRLLNKKTVGYELYLHAFQRPI